MTDTPQAGIRAPRKGRPRLTDPGGPDRATIVATAVQLAAQPGCTELKMRDVADALGVSPKLLYRHVAGKAALLDLASAAIVDRWEFPPAELPWPERLTRIMRETQQMLRRYPAIAGPAVLRNLDAQDTPEAARVVAAFKSCLIEAGLSRTEADRLFLLYTVLALGEITMAAAVAEGALPASTHAASEHIDLGLDTALRWLIAGIRASRSADVVPLEQTLS